MHARRQRHLTIRTYSCPMNLLRGLRGPALLTLRAQLTCKSNSTR
jgi:hypothetical protein